jgi:hypothetical protein
MSKDFLIDASIIIGTFTVCIGGFFLAVWVLL